MKTILLLAVFLIPLIGATPRFGFEQIKILYFIVLTSLIGFVWTPILSGQVEKGIKWTWISKAAGVFILCLLLTSFTGINIESSILGSQPYFQGWILYVYLFLFFLAVSYAKVNLKYWAIVLVGSASLVSILAIKDWVLLNIFNHPVPTYVGRVMSTFGQPNFYAGFLLLTLPFSYYLFKNHPLSSPQKRGSINNWIPRVCSGPWPAFAGMTITMGIFVSYSRSAILLALFLMMLGLADQLKAKLRVIVSVVAVVLTAFCIGFAFSSGFIGNEFSKPLFTRDPDLTQESVENRVYIWPVAWQLFLQRPLLGYGLENINKSFTDYFRVNNHILFEANFNVSPVLLSLRELNIDRTHNYLLDLLLFSGVIGAISWIGLLVVLFRKLIQKVLDREHNVKILAVSLITCLIWIQFQNQSIVQLIYFWLLAGLINQERGIDKGGGSVQCLIYMPVSTKLSVNKLNQRGAAHLLVPLILLIGIIAGVYLVVTGNLKLFSKAGNPPIVFKSTTGQALTNNSQGIPQSTAPAVRIEFTSSLGPPLTVQQKSTVSGPVKTFTVAFKFAEDPTSLDKAGYIGYSVEPFILNYGFRDRNPGTKFIWAEFRDNNGKTERKNAQIEIISAGGPPSGDILCGDPCRSDINKDGTVDSSKDVERLQACYGKSAKDKDVRGKLCIDADIAQDGTVNVRDFSCLKAALNKKCSTPTQTPAANQITVFTSCDGSTLKASISGTVASPSNRSFGLWSTLTDGKTGQSMIYSYIGNEYPYASNIAVNFPQTGAIRGSSIPIAGDGRTYTVKVYAAAFTTGTPALNSPVAQASFSKVCATPTPTPAPSVSPLTVSTNIVYVNLSKKNAVNGIVYGPGLTITSNNAYAWSLDYTTPSNYTYKDFGFIPNQGMITPGFSVTVQTFIRANLPVSSGSLNFSPYRGVATLNYYKVPGGGFIPVVPATTVNYVINLTD